MDEIANRIRRELELLEDLPENAKTNIPGALNCLHNRDADGLMRIAVAMLLECEIAGYSRFRPTYDLMTIDYASADRAAGEDLESAREQRILKQLSAKVNQSYEKLYPAIFAVSSQLDSIGVGTRSELVQRLAAIEDVLGRLDSVFEEENNTLEGRISEMRETLLYQREMLDDLEHEYEENETGISKMSLVINELELIGEQEADGFAHAKEFAVGFELPVGTETAAEEVERAAIPLAEYPLVVPDDESDDDDDFIRLELLIDEIRCILMPKQALMVGDADDMTMSVGTEGNIISEPQNSMLQFP